MQQDFRVHYVTLVTTLLDAKLYTVERLADAYNLQSSVARHFALLKTWPASPQHD